MVGMIALALWLKDTEQSSPFNEYLAPTPIIWENFDNLVALAMFGLELVPNKGFE